MDNLTEISSNSWSGEVDTIDCNDLTNNGLYVLFAGYLLPLLSPKIREYGRELLTSFKNAGKVASDIVSVTEFGFEKIQNLSNNEEMVHFIQRFCDKKDLNILSSEIKELAWKFSGDTQNGKKEPLQQTWKKLTNDLDRLNTLNRMDKTKVNKP